MLNDTSVKTYIIRHKDTKKLFIAPSGKSSWRTTGAAKNAFAQIGNYGMYGLEPVHDGLNWRGELRFRAPLFGEQDVYEIVELSHEIEERLVQAERLLIEALGVITCEGMTNAILDFLGEPNEGN